MLDARLTVEGVPAGHLRRRGQTEFGQDRWGNVDQGGRVTADPAVAEQDAGYFERVGAMVGAPGRSLSSRMSSVKSPRQVAHDAR